MNVGVLTGLLHHDLSTDSGETRHRGERVVIGALMVLLVLSAITVVGGLVLGNGTGAGAGAALVGGICFVLSLGLLLLPDFRAACRAGADDWDKMVRSDGQQPERKAAWIDRAERMPDTNRLVLVALDGRNVPYPAEGEALASYPAERFIHLARTVNYGTENAIFDSEVLDEGRVTRWAEIPHLYAPMPTPAVASGAGGPSYDMNAKLLAEIKKRTAAHGVDSVYPPPVDGDDHD